MENNLFEKVFARRSTVCFFVLMLMLLTCVLRVAVIMDGDLEEVGAKQSSYKIKIGSIRGTIYDRNMVPITNNKSAIYGIALPKPTAITAVSSILSGDELARVLETLKSNKPAVFKTEKTIEADGVSFTKVYSNESRILSPHIIGYTNTEGHGVSGIEAAYDEFLYSEGEVSAAYIIDGKGRALKGLSPYFQNDLGEVTKGVVTTLDVNIQSIVERAAEGIEKGAVLVAETETGKIRASVSKPTFDIENLSNYLEDENAPLLNRALQCFSVGSAFKPCVAAAALEKGTAYFNFECTGKTHIIDRDFKCHKIEGHGLMDIKSAIANSCNTFFYTLGINTGATEVYNMASSLSFGSSIKIAKNMETAKGNLTDLKRLSNPASLANLSIGQGDLLLSPVAMLNLYSAIGGDGTYRLPSLIEKTIKDGETREYEISKPTRVMEEETAEKLRDYLKAVVEEGTGISAKPTFTTAAGKTATAQTGRYNENGIEINNSWFCGFFPYENPKYTVIVMAEESTTRAVCTAFSQIADSITELENLG